MTKAQVHRLLKAFDQHSIVEILWEDAKSIDDWTQIGDIDGEVVPTKTVGYLLKVTTRAVSLAPTVNGEGDAGSTYVIPLGMVTGLKLLRG